MAYHDDLLLQAFQLVHKERLHPKQASLRRAVSTAYYALFHFLISEATSNWSHVHARASLGRAFDHQVMKAASNRLGNPKQFPFTGEDRDVVDLLRKVAAAFAFLQEKRHTADYDNTTVWTRTDALRSVDLAARAFALWKTIRKERIAQEYLVALLVKKRD